MNADDIRFRPARQGDGAAVHDVTWASVRGLQASHYSPAQIEVWMGSRNEAWHEALIINGRMVLAVRGDRIVGFVHTLPGEINRLFVLPEEASKGLGKRLLLIGVENAREGHSGPLKLASSLNAAPFYERFGFRVVERGYYLPEVGGGTAEMIKMEL